MTQTLEYGGYTVEHRINPRMKNCYVVVEGEGKIILKTPRMAQKEALKIIEKKLRWIERKLQQQQERVTLGYKRGEEVRYFGQLHRVHEDERFDDLADALGRLRNSDEPSLQRCYDTFYKNRTLDHLAERLEHFENMTGLRAEALKVRKMRSRWGSCSSRGVITFNTHIMQLHEELIDYIVVHELAHLEHMNHSKAFYALVEESLPHHKQLQKALKEVRLT